MAQLEWPPPAAGDVIECVRAFNNVGSTCTFNLLCYQDGTLWPADLEVLRKVKATLRG